MLSPIQNLFEVAREEWGLCYPFAMTDDALSRGIADRLNASCFCMTLDRDLLCRKMEQVTGDPEFCRAHVATREHLFSNVPVFLPRPALEQMQRVVTAIEATARLPAYRRKVLSWAPDIAQRDHGPVGAFMGYDFHLDGNGPRLIEINTNAGGGVLNLLLAEAQHACCREMEALPPGRRVISPRRLPHCDVQVGVAQAAG